jgi:hypothetical protein
MKTLEVKGTPITVLAAKDGDYLSPTFMLKAEDGDFLGIWKSVFNPDFS